jgi:hypothetical protein
MSLMHIHIVICLALLYSQFCRAVKTDRTTKMPVLLAFYALTVAVVFSLFAPAVLPGWQPSPDSILFMFAVLVVQAVTSVHWRHGVPDAFREQMYDDFEDSQRVG